MKAILLAAIFASSTVALATPTIKSADGKHEHGTGLLKLPEAFQGMGQTAITLDDCEGLPDDFDLRDLGVVPPVKDQGSCGSCWSFSKTGALESLIAGTTGAIPNLAEQQLVSQDSNNYGCGGGLLNSKEFQFTKGEVVEEDCPYKGTSNARCKAGAPAAAKLPQSSFVVIKHGADYEKQVKCAMFKTKTIPWVTVAAGGARWSRPPTATAATWPGCGNRSTNHAIGAVGWTTVGGKTYFKGKNSWGASWGSSAGHDGEKGYMLIPLGCDAFGDEIAFPTAALTPCAPPKVRLPVEVTGTAGDEIVLAVKAETGVAYNWTKDGVPMGSGAMIPVTVGAEAVYKVTAKNACGSAESQVRVKSAFAAH